MQQISTPQHKFEFNLEALRGLAALIVVIRHVLLMSPVLMTGYEISGAWKYVPPGHLSVLVFFMLSGYVIGLTNKTPINSWKSCKDYLKRRFIRLYPIYLLSILLTLGISFSLLGKVYSLPTIIQHLTFSQVTLGKVMNENNPLWSLNYEVIYYLLFILISRFSIKPIVAIFFATAVATLTAVMPQWFDPMLASYSYGLIFWLSGFWLAQLYTTNTFNPITRFSQLISFIFLFLSFEQMNYMQRMFQKLRLDVSPKQVDNFHQQIVDFSDLSYLLFCLAGIMLFTDKKFKIYNGLKYVIYTMPLVYLAVRIGKGDLLILIESKGVGFVALFYIISLFFLLKATAFNNLCQKAIEFIIPLGSISYGIYVVHYPIIFMIGSVSIFSHSFTDFTIRIIIYLVLTLLLGFFLEKKVQPLFRSLKGG